jgi:hypothetical protein
VKTTTGFVLVRGLVSIDDHGSCKACGADLNRERVYDYFLQEYGGDQVKALATASMYGCRPEYGRFGRAILVKDSFDRSIRWWKCPDCGKECY